MSVIIKRVQDCLTEMRQILRNQNVTLVSMTLPEFTLDELGFIAENFGSRVSTDNGSFCTITVWTANNNGQGLLICRTKKEEQKNG